MPLTTVSVYVASLKVAVTVMLAAGMVAMVGEAAGLARHPVSPVHLSKTFPSGTVAVTVTAVPAVYDPPPVPLTTASVYVASLKVAVTVMLAAGMVTVVGEAAASARFPVWPVHLSKTFPSGMTAVMVTAVPAVYDPPPVPLTTVSV